MAGNVRWVGYAELRFRESAHLALAQAIELVGATVDADHPAAWVVEERRLVFEFEAVTSRAELEAHRRVLESLVREAESGEVAIEIEEAGERWVRRADASETRALGSALGSTEQSESESPEVDTRPTIRTEAG